MATTEDAHTLGAWLASYPSIDLFDRQLLAGHVLKLNRAQVMTHAEQPLSEAERHALQAPMQRLCAGEPMAYILGYREFWSLSLRVNADVLVPRPETELLVELGLEKICGDQPRVVDLGTGSGAIIIALGHELQRCNRSAQLHATDASAAALSIAQENAARYQVPVTWHCGHWLQPLHGRFQCIISNPPYIAVDDEHLATLSHEPSGALVSGRKGLDDLQSIIQSAPQHLDPGGWLLLEHGYDQAAAVQQILIQQDMTAVTTHKDLSGVERVTIGQKREAKKRDQQRSDST